jgi:putative transposase
MIPATPNSTGAIWARFRFSVVGSLLSSPPARGALQRAIHSLAQKTWSHPVTGRDVQFAADTIARWYYTASRQRDDPVGALRRAVRKDCGEISLAAAFAQRLQLQYLDHPHWSYQLHYDNLAASARADPSLGRLPSYSTVKRYMQAHAWLRKPGPRLSQRPGEVRAETRRQNREIRSYEATHVGALWHLDFHYGSKKVLTPEGRWRTPMALGILDDHSRLCCHIQWYLWETAEDLVHGLSQAIQKRGLPRALLTDNGSAMVAEEVTEGLLRLGIVHERTLPYSPYQNGKQEAFWGRLEGRLVKMLDGVGELTLDFLNRATQAWVEIEYNRAAHREISSSPLERFAHAPEVLRTSPTSESLRDAFRLETTRTQRQSDGTISIEGVRFEIPARYRHFREVSVRYARWDLGRVDLVDERSGTILAPIYPLDKAANADGRRAAIEPGGTARLSSPKSDMPTQERPRTSGELPPLLKRILQEYSATGMPPAYLPKTSPPTSRDLPTSNDGEQTS